MDIRELQRELDIFKQQGLKLDLTRGKPSADQLALSDTLDGILDGNYRTRDGVDARNYGGLRGIEEIRELGAFLLDVPPANAMAGGNSSLQLMYHTVACTLQKGLAGGRILDSATPTAICPVPGYDRHFTLMDSLDVAMVSVPILSSGPDMDAVERLVRDEAMTSFLWCVPKSSNPTGCTYSDETVERIVALPALRGLDSGNDFYVLWDNAYAVHDFQEDASSLKSIFDVACELGTQDRIILFASTSKITHAGSGVAFIGGSELVLASLEQYLAAMTVGPDKVNQLRHARFLRDADGIRALMQQHAEIVAPKFEVVLSGLEEHLGNTGLATWTQPTGGYFVSLDLQPGLAKATVAAAASVGLALTPAGATYPHGLDPNDSNVRIAPTFANVDEIKIAIEILGTCVKYAAAKANS